MYENVWTEDIVMTLFTGAQLALAWIPCSIGQREQSSPGQPAVPLRHLFERECPHLRADTEKGVWFDQGNCLLWHGKKACVLSNPCKAFCWYCYISYESLWMESGFFKWYALFKCYCGTKVHQWTGLFFLFVFLLYGFSFFEGLNVGSHGFLFLKVWMFWFFS